MHEDAGRPAGADAPAGAGRSLTPSAYQRGALATARGEALDLDYLGPGFLAEVGELAGAVAKCVRDGRGDLDRRVRGRDVTYRAWARDELGDCYWFLAVLCDARGLALPESLLRPVASGIGAQASPRERVHRLAAHLAEASGEAPAAFDPAWWAGRLAWCADALGTRPAVLARANLAKLADRARRGVIGGSGDGR